MAHEVQPSLEPEQVAQAAAQATQVLVPEGWYEVVGQVVQVVAEPAQVLHEASQLSQAALLSLANWPDGQLATHVLPLR